MILNETKRRQKKRNVAFFVHANFVAPLNFTLGTRTEKKSLSRSTEFVLNPRGGEKKVMGVCECTGQW